MPIRKIISSSINDSAITASKIAANTVASTDLAKAYISSPTISNILYPNNATAASVTGNQFIHIIGSSFRPGVRVYIGNNLIHEANTLYYNQGNIRVLSPPKAIGTYKVVTINPDGVIALNINGYVVSGEPTWNTSATLNIFDALEFVNVTLSANAAVSYVLQSGSTLPSNLSLASNGFLSGNVLVNLPNTNYSFTVEAIDAENQRTPRTFTLPIGTNNPPVFANTTLSTIVSNVFYVANITAIDKNKNLFYDITQGTLPPGLTLAANGRLSGNVTSLTQDTSYNVMFRAINPGGIQSENPITLDVEMPDQFWANTVMLLRGDTVPVVDAANVSRTFTTTGSTIVFPSGNVNTNFGLFSGSIYSNAGGNNGTLRASDSSINIPGAFTIECWVYLTAGGRNVIVGTDNGNAYSTNWGWGIMDTTGPYGTPGATKGVCWMLSPINGYGGNMVSGGQYPTLNTWTHIATVRDASNNWYFFMDGVLGTTANYNSQTHPNSFFPTNNGPAGSLFFNPIFFNWDGFVSGGNSTAMASGFNGFIDEFRVTLAARYTSSFTRPTRRFKNF